MIAVGEDPSVVVQGIVVPVVWDPVGKPLRVAILTVDEGEYPIAPRGLGRGLFRCLREEVRARLVLGADIDGGGDARVVSFTVVQRCDEGDIRSSLGWNGPEGSEGDYSREIGVGDEL